MASPTRITRRRRKMKRHKKGKNRKKELVNKGTTRSEDEIFGSQNS